MAKRKQRSFATFKNRTRILRMGSVDANHYTNVAFRLCALLSVEPGKMAQKEGGSKDSGETGRWEGRRGG